MTTTWQRPRAAAPKAPRPLTAGDVVSRFPETVEAGASVQEAAGRMRAFGVGFLPVLRRRSVVGVVTDRDLVTRVLARPGGPERTTVEEIMTPDAVSCDSHAPISLVIRTLSTLKIRRLPVLDTGLGLLGVIGLADLVRAGQEQAAGRILKQLCRAIPLLPIGIPDL